MWVKSSTNRSILFLLIIVIGLAVLSQQTSFFKVDDFVGFWSTGKVINNGGNPYNPAELLKVQISANLPGKLQFVWNPPTTLILFIPLAMLNYQIGRMIWYLFSVGLLVASAALIWKLYGGKHKMLWFAILLCLLFGPSLQVLKIGQIGPVLLLGIIGFLYYDNERRGLIAGGFASIVIIKPHIFYLFGIALLLWIFQKRKWDYLAGLILAILLSISIPLIANPNLISQYLHAMGNIPDQGWATAVFGSALRIVFGVDNFWLLFIPPLLGGVWFIFYWRQHHKHWVWLEQMPLIMLVSMATSAHGWVFDHVVLILAVIQVGVWILQFGNFWQRASIAFSFIVVNLLVTFVSAPQFWFWWLASFYLIWYLIVCKMLDVDLIKQFKTRIIV